MLDRGEMLLEQRQQRGVGAAGQHLGDKCAAGRKLFDREMRRQFDQAHGPQVIGLFVPGGVGSHVGNHQIGRPIERSGQRRGRVIGHEVHLQNGHAFDRVGRQQIDADHRGVGAVLAHHLRPAARGNPQIDHPPRAFEQAELLVNLDQLERGAAAPALCLGPLDIRIGQLPR